VATGRARGYPPRVRVILGLPNEELFGVVTSHHDRRNFTTLRARWRGNVTSINRPQPGVTESTPSPLHPPVPVRLPALVRTHTDPRRGSCEAKRTYFTSGTHLGLSRKIEPCQDGLSGTFVARHLDRRNFTYDAVKNPRVHNQGLDGRPIANRDFEIRSPRSTDRSTRTLRRAYDRNRRDHPPPNPRPSSNYDRFRVVGQTVPMLSGRVTEFQYDDGEVRQRHTLPRRFISTPPPRGRSPTRTMQPGSDQCRRHARTYVRLRI